MKVLMINGSPRPRGCTFTALSVVAEALNREGVETEIVQSGVGALRDCIGCRKCRETGDSRCIFNDDVVNGIIAKAEQADGFVFGSPVYYAHPSGRILSLLERLFYAGSEAFMNKPGAAVVSARRAGTTASLDVLNKYFTISGMPVASSQYWNSIHGRAPGEAEQDGEGRQTMRTLARNMTFLMKRIALGKDQFGLPEKEERIATHFIR